VLLAAFNSIPAEFFDRLRTAKSEAEDAASGRRRVGRSVKSPSAPQPLRVAPLRVSPLSGEDLELKLGKFVLSSVPLLAELRDASKKFAFLGLPDGIIL
jgi:hypothetical protein